ncbi:MAG: hypothetical protein P6H82_03390 [Candidatus Arsenophonus melophagi]|nr:hypothetical protein [Candidatus Arsenophonus melophagi]
MFFNHAAEFHAVGVSSEPKIVRKILILLVLWSKKDYLRACSIQSCLGYNG